MQVAVGVGWSIVKDKVAGGLCPGALPAVKLRTSAVMEESVSLSSICTDAERGVG